MNLPPHIQFAPLFWAIHAWFIRLHQPRVWTAAFRATTAFPPMYASFSYIASHHFIFLSLSLQISFISN